MDNKDAVEMIKCLVANYGSYLDDKTAGYNNHDLCKALMKAIKSLEAWNKIKEQIEEEKSYAHADYNGYKNDVLKFDPYYIDGDYPLPKNYFGEGMERAEDIINKHLSEDIRYEESDKVQTLSK